MPLNVRYIVKASYNKDLEGYNFKTHRNKSLNISEVLISKPEIIDRILTNNFKEQVEIYKKRKENYLKEKNNKNGIRDSNISLYSNRESNPDGGRKTGPSGEVIEEDPNEYTVDGNTKGSIGRFFSGIFK